jgi:hypothetical protein
MSIKLRQNNVTFNDGSTQSVRFDKDLDAKGELIRIDSFPSADLLTTSTSGSYTWNRPAGCTMIKVIVVGAGGGASCHGESGGAGGYAEKWIDVTNISSVAVTIGGRGGGVNYGSAGGDGATSSFGSYCSATGGYGGNRNWSHSGGHGGVGHGGDINLYGGGGSGHDNRGGKGGMSFLGGSKFPGWSNNSYSSTGEDHYMGPGSGGSGCHTNHGRGGHGACGAVIVYCYK